eukprot:10847716-Lingulodinium_polyedra.AAC.1
MVVPRCRRLPMFSPAKLNMLVFKAGFTKGDADRVTKVLGKSEHLRSRILQNFGPSEALILEDEPMIKDFFVWAMKKGALSINVAQNSMAMLRGVTSEHSTVRIILIPFSQIQ